jgi:hypothetical protein
MKKYKNVSGYPLPIDCISCTKYMMPGEIASLPLSRDVRHYSTLRKLVTVNERLRLGDKTFNNRKVPTFKKPIKKVGNEDKVINLKKDGDK